MPSETEGRIALALQAYISNQTLSLYDVPFATLRERHLGVLCESRSSFKQS
jgi:hypothetical protein